jgi:eukaryotic-like serine/threonine-protein kinase
MEADPEAYVPTEEFAESAALPPQHGEDRYGQFQILKTLGTGRFGTVHLAIDRVEQREVALKVFDPSSLPEASHAAAAQHFVDVAQAAMTLRHPNIASVFDVCHNGEAPHVAMESVYNGRTLQRYCEPESERLSIEDAIRIIQRCADALHYAHERGVLHRDVKPTNILMGVALEPKITDFGIGVLARPGSATDTNGDLHQRRYLSPEQIIDRHVERTADVFSLGVILYELLTGRHPFMADSLTKQYRNIVKDRHVPLRKYRSDAPRVLEMIVNRCLAKRPSNRYETAMHLSANLDVARDVIASSTSGVAKAQIFIRVRRLPQFSKFSEDELKETILNSKYCTFRSGDEIIAQGDTASCIYIVIDGEVGVRKDAFEFINLGPGECIGEIGALTGRPRRATVVALDRCGLLSIPMSFLRTGPLNCQVRIKDILLSTLAERLADVSDSIC